MVVQWWQINVQKIVMQEQICCFANQTYCFFLTFLLPSPLYGLRSLLLGQRAVVAYTWEGGFDSLSDNKLQQ